jgi:hypothetical protein
LEQPEIPARIGSTASIDGGLLQFAIAHCRQVGHSKVTECKICSSDAVLFDVVDFGRQCSNVHYPSGLSGFPVYFHRCLSCGLIFTCAFDSFSSEEWSRFVYNDDYGAIDPDYSVTRPRRNAQLVKAAIGKSWRSGDTGCDFGGGSGETARCLSEWGLPFDCHDPYGAPSISVNPGQYRVVTAFEVLEHLSSPASEFRSIIDLGSAEAALFLFSTSTVPERIESGTLPQWWYAAPRNGHITLYSVTALVRLANQHGLGYEQVTRGLHLFGRNMDLQRAKRTVLARKIIQRALPWLTS